MPSMMNYEVLLRQFTENEFQLRAVFGLAIFSAVLFLLVLMALLFSAAKNKPKTWCVNQDPEESFQVDGT